MNAALGPEYARQPLAFVDGIPVFSERDRYVANYERIALDHVNAMEAGSENPFMDIQLWKLSEEATRRIVAHHVPDGSKVLDVGAGLGRVMGPLTQYERFGIDISIDYLKHARARGLNVAFSRIEDMPFVDECFDAAIVCDVLEHVLDLNACVRQILRVIKPGGLLVVRVPYKEDLTGYLDPSMPYEFVHLRNFDEQSLQLFFEKIMGCHVEYMEQVAPCFSPDRLKLRLPARDGFLQQLAKRIGPQGESALPPRREGFVDRLRKLLIEPSSSRDMVGQPPEVEHPLEPLKLLAQFNQDQLLNWLTKLREEHPDWAEMLLPHVTEALEINVIVRKPAI